jgi:hypothetical protein
MIDVELVQVAGQLGRAEEDKYKDFDGNHLPDAHIAAFDVHEEDMPVMPCVKPTFITAVNIKDTQAISICYIGVDYEKDEVVSFKPVGTGPGRDLFPDGFFHDPGVRSKVHAEIKNLPEYKSDYHFYLYTKNVRDLKDA